MSHHVLVQRLARKDLADAYQYAARRAPQTARRWLDRFEAALRTLAHHPERWPLARENGKVELEVREFHFGKRPHVFRVIFTVDGASVRILRIRRAQRRALTRRQLERAWEEEDQTELGEER